MPHLEALLPYEIHISFSEAEAAEAEFSETQAPEVQAPETQAERTQEMAAEEASASAESSSIEPSATASSAAASSEGESSGLGLSSVSFKVDDFTGAAHMSYPIVVPPGRAGLAPQLSLSYVSSGGNGWVGVGWDIPIGYIQRRGPRKGIPKYNDTSDVYELSLGGASQELVSIGGDEYRLKIEGALLWIKYYSTGNYWEVKDKSGTKMTFGATVNSLYSRIGKVRDPETKNETFRWCLNRVEDTRSNNMELIYYRDQDANNTYQIYLQKIQYNGQASGGLPHNHEILFNLESTDRPDPIYNYRGGFKTLTRKRLSSIEIKTNGTPVRKYQLEYMVSNTRSLLSSVTLYGNDYQSNPNPIPLPPTVFTYQAIDMQNIDNRGFGLGTDWPNPSAWHSIKGNLIRNNDLLGRGTYTDIMDLDGDALPDRVVYDKTSPYNTWAVYLNNKSGFDSEGNWPNPGSWDNIWGNYIRNIKQKDTYTDVIDMNGDGLSDRVIYDKDYAYNSQNPQPAYWEVYLNNGSGFQAPPISWRNASAWSDTLGNLIRNADNHGTFTDVIDMNGDGFADRVVYCKNCTPPYETNCPWSVYLNNGNGFEDIPISWPNPSAWGEIGGNYIRNTDTLGRGVYTDVIDMNGDGLPDRVVYDRWTSEYKTWKVYFNNGRGFDPGVDWPNPSAWEYVDGNYIRNTNSYGTYTDVTDMNGDGLPDRVVYDGTSPYTTWTVHFNYGSGFGLSVDWPNPSSLGRYTFNYIRDNYFDGTYMYGTKADVIDMDGDGLQDRVTYDRTSPYNTWSVYFNKGPVSDLLKKVENGIGGTTEITYLPSTAYEDDAGNKVNHIPFVVQTVRSYTQNDGRNNYYTYKYFYSDASYDPIEVEFRGFKYVTAYQMANPTEHESMTETEFHQDYYLKGKIQTQTIVSRPPQGYTEGHEKEIVNIWLVADTLGGGFPYLDTATTTVTDQGIGGPFYYSQTTKDIYDIRPDDQYNQTFNLLREYKNQGSPEEIVTLLEYLENRTSWILSKITKATVTDSSGIIASRKWMDYNTDGELITEEICKSDTPNTGCINRSLTQNVITSYQYDSTYKVLNQITDPRGYITTMTYDSTKTFVYETTKCIEGGRCFTTTSVYDPGTGNITKVVPPHFQGTPNWLQTQYDVFGRKTLERMKDNIDPNSPPILDRGSTSYTYYDSDNANTQYVLKTGRIVIENTPERTLTLNGWTYFDGLGRTYFARTDGPEGKTIAVETIFDNVGRVWKQSNPYFVGETPYYTVFTYDGLSRLTDTLKTDGYYIHTDYEGLRKVVSKQVTTSDWQSTAYYYDLNQKLVKVGEGFELPGQETFTEYTYDILGNLTQVKAAKDASGNDLLGASITTTMTYDSLLKKRSMTDPDMGYWTYDYDKMGNLTSQTDAKNQTITFSYDGLNRLTEKIYVNSNPPERVVYTYDDPLIPNSKGKLTKVSHLVGNPEEEVDADFVLEYDLNQRVKRSKKKIGTEEKTFEKTYDSAGRVVSITYPGNKTYSYEYDVAGDLLYVKDNATGNNLVEYSVFTALGQHKIATFPKPNNVSVKTTYDYYPETGRLKTLKTEKLLNGQVTSTYQNLKYQQIDESPGYDGAGNIKILADIRNNITHNYTYDHLNRLTLANGVGTNAYTQSYQYDRIGNITYKSDVGNYTYFYNNRPHAVRSTTGPINITLDYDLNGNMISRIDGTKSLNLTYNYDNKPELIKKDGIDYLHFAYDGSGQRVIKYNYSTGQSVIYFGDLLEIRPQGEVMHIYAGSQRVASVPLSGCVRFYHPNHLGSASFITDGNGDPKELIEYFPFGTYRDRQDFDSQCPNVNYTFTDQEDDDELGLYNYGARLYDPVLGRFISPDSIVQAPDDPQTLNRYSYARNNPIIYTDPSGNIAIIDDIIGLIATAITTYISSSITYGTAVVIAKFTLSAVAGAALGAATSAITGGNIGLGALTGAISGLIFCAVGEFAVPAVSGALGAKTGLEIAAVTTVVHMAAGAISGGINSAITGSDIGLGMLTGAIGAGIGAATGGALKLLDINQFGYQLVARTVAGGIAGGVVSEIYGGNFWQGFGQGSATAAAGFLFNEMLHIDKDTITRFMEAFESNRVPGANIFGIPTGLISLGASVALTGGPTLGEKIGQNLATGAFESQQLTKHGVYVKNFRPEFFKVSGAFSLLGKASWALTVFYVSADVTTFIYTALTFD